jgi:hypothetical protein
MATASKEMTMRSVVCWFEICIDGSTQWEMVDPVNAECIEYFHTKEEAQEYAAKNNIIIAEWIKD